MKLTITRTTAEVEGAASEIAEALPAVLATQTEPVATAPLVAAPAAPPLLEAPAAPAPVDELHADVVLPPLPADTVLPHERVAAMEDWSPVDADPSDAPTKPIDRWELVPIAHRVWNSTRQVVHVSREPNAPESTWCGVDVGMFRDPALEPLAGATVCGNCNHRIEEAGRA